jgi:murein DD-endopeptidase MepM/ murein hydrolase activator NlpD
VSRLLTKYLIILLLKASLILSSAVFAATAVPGGVYVWQAPADATDITFGNKPVMRVGDTVFVGLPIAMQAGHAQIDYRLADQARQHRFVVFDKQYTEQHITITDQAMVDPPAETLQRIRKESVRQRGLYNSFNPPVDLADGFLLPLQGTTTSLYGHRRFFNGQPRNPHSGLDIAAPTGTPIKAAARGRVTLADELYFNGNTLFVDHGQGLITMYCHMSELLVSEGDEIAQGQEIGLVGATGRVTGPHLHWSVSLNGNRVDPEVFMQALNAAVTSSSNALSSSAPSDAE